MLTDDAVGHAAWCDAFGCRLFKQCLMGIGPEVNTNPAGCAGAEQVSAELLRFAVASQSFPTLASAIH